MYAATVLDQVTVAVFELRTPIQERYVKDGVVYEVWLRPPNTNSFEPKTQTESGSGFFLTTTQMMYLVTAKHLAMNCNSNTEMIFGSDGRPASLSIRDLTGPNSTNKMWLNHEHADVAIMPIFPTMDSLKSLAGRSIGLEMLQQDLAGPRREIPLTIVGFPLDAGAHGHFFSPLSRETKAASGLVTTSQGNFFFLQDPSIEGYSGSPVLDLGGAFFLDASLQGLQRPLKCFGVVSSTISDNTGGKLCAVVPAYYVLELVKRMESDAKFQHLLKDWYARIGVPSIVFKQ
jgi:hypothetical protein